MEGKKNKEETDVKNDLGKRQKRKRKRMVEEGMGS